MHNFNYRQKSTILTINMTSFVKIASNSRQAEDLACSTSYQALASDKNLPKNYNTMKLVKSWRSRAPIAVKLLNHTFLDNLTQYQGSNVHNATSDVGAVPSLGLHEYQQ
jgi:hypothetical protein